MRLAELIRPIDRDAFLQTYWEKRHLVVEGAPDRFRPLLTIAEVPRLLHYLKPRAPGGMLVVKGSQHLDRRWIYDDGTPRLEDVRAAWRDGYSIVVNSLEKLWEPIAGFVAALTDDLHHPADVNLYLTPPGAQAFVPHYDVMDVFILQVEGAKRWQVREPVARLPLPDEPTRMPSGELPPLLWEGELTAGDMLYMPRGHVHSATTSDVASLHLTVGVKVIRWRDLLAAAVNAAQGEDRLREALPPGFFAGGKELAATFAELAAGLPAGLSLEPAVAAIADKLLVSGAAPPSRDLFAVQTELQPDAVLEKREGVILNLVERDGFAAIQYPGGKLAGPRKIAAALRYIVATPRFCAAALPGDLNDREKLVLARRLVRDGLVDVCAAE